MVQNHLCNFGRRHYEEQFCEILLNLNQWFKRRCRLEYFLSGALAALSFSGVETSVQFSRIHCEEQFFEIILNLNQWFRKKYNQIAFFILSFGSPFVQRRRTICAILVECIIRKNSVKLFRIWTSGSEELSFKDISYRELWRSFCAVEENYLCNLGKMHYE